VEIAVSCEARGLSENGKKSEPEKTQESYIAVTINACTVWTSLCTDRNYSLNGRDMNKVTGRDMSNKVSEWKRMERMSERFELGNESKRCPTESAWNS